MHKRLDVLLLDLGLFNSRESAKRAVMAGEVFIEDQLAQKPGISVDANSKIRIVSRTPKFVSRGALKLKPVLDLWEINLEGVCVLDIGASTGGFTDLALQRGAKKVYAVDVGINQLAEKLKRDPKVVNCEKCNARYLNEDLFEDPIDFSFIDVSFISLRKILPGVLKVLSLGSEIIMLVKPQFELERKFVQKGGVVKSELARQGAVDLVKQWCEEHNLYIIDSTRSGLPGAKKGNREYFLYARVKNNS